VLPVTRLERCPRCFRRNPKVVITTVADIVVGWHITTHYACKCGWHADVVSAREKETAA
jgi:hypothetical protein